MFSSWKQRIILGFYVLVLLAVPVGAYLVSQHQSTKASANQDNNNQNPLGGLKPLTNNSTGDKSSLKLPSDTTPQSEPSASPEVTFGPTLNFKVILEGRPTGKMASKFFVGIVEGSISNTAAPKYLLSFNITLPDSGSYSGLSLAGLTPGNTYSAILKGPAQIATSSAFVMSPSNTNLNNNESITLLTGDLNEDNIVNDADYSIAKAAFGATKTSSKWNENIDFNLDGIINTADLLILNKNMHTTGQSGVWISPPPPAPSPSPNAGGEAPSGSPAEGYWFWMPKIN